MRLAVRMLVRRPAALLATFVACLFAAGMVSMCGALFESGLRYHGSVARYSAAPVVVAAPELRHVHHEDDEQETTYASLEAPRPLPTALAKQLRDASGVRAVAPDVAAAAGLQGTRSTTSLELHTWGATSLGHIRLLAGHPPAGTGHVALDQRTAERVGARVGDHVQVWTAAGATPVTVTGIVAEPEHTGASAYLEAAANRGLMGHAPQVLGVLPEPGVATGDLADTVRNVVARYSGSGDGVYPQVLVGADRGRAETDGVATSRTELVAMSAAFGGSTLLVAGLVIANTVGLSVRQRLRDVALLRALAATPRQVRRMIGAEVLTVAALAALPGVALGTAAAGWLRDGFVQHGIAPSVFSVHGSWLPKLVAAAATVLVAVVAARVASMRPSRIRPTAALTESLVERTRLGAPRLVLGLLAAAGAVTVCTVAATTPAVAQPVAIATLTLCTLAVALLGPYVLRLVSATFGRLAGVLGEPGRLAAATVSVGARRMSAVLTSLALTVGLIGGLWFVLTTTSHAASGQVVAGLRADAVAVGAGIPPEAAAQVRGLDGIAAVTEVIRGTVLTTAADDVNEHSVQGVTTGELDRTLDLHVVAGSLRHLRGDAVAVDERTAVELHLQVGSRLSAYLGDGTPTTLRVVAKYTRGLGFADLTMNRSALAPHVGDGSDDALLVTGTPAGVDRARSTLAVAAPPDVDLVPAALYRTALGAERQANAWANQVITVVLVGYVALAAVNTLIVHTLARRREFGVLRLSGATRRQLRGSLALEQALLLGTAVVLGVATAAAALLPSVHAVTGSVHPYIPLPDWAGVGAGLVIVTAVAVALPARRAMRGRAIEAAAASE